MMSEPSYNGERRSWSVAGGSMCTCSSPDAEVHKMRGLTGARQRGGSSGVG